MKNIVSLCLILLFWLLFVSPVNAKKVILKVFHAGSLAVPFAAIEKAFETRYPWIDVKREASGSVKAVRKVTDLHKPCDIVASADYSLIPQMMFPKYTEHVKLFARNELVVAYTEKSKLAKEINSGNWFEILAHPEVKWAFSNPNLDPCGYRSVMTIVIAELYYQKPIISKLLKPYVPFEFKKKGDEVVVIVPKNFSPRGKKIFIRPKEVELLGLLEGGAIDYIVIYLSVAKQHHLKYIKLPPEINLGNTKHREFYRKVSIMLGHGTKVVGKPIVYGIAALKTAPNPKEAKLFEDFVTSEEGAKIIKECFQTPIYPALEIKWKNK